MHRCLRVLEAVAPVDPGKGRGVRGTSLPCRSRLSVEGGRVERGVRWNGQPHRGQSFFRLARHSRASGVSRYSSRCWSEMRARMSPTAAGLVWKDPPGKEVRGVVEVEDAACGAPSAESREPRSMNGAVRELDDT